MKLSILYTKNIARSVAFLAISMTTAPAFAEAVASEAQENYANTLTGDWGGTRSALENAGISTEITYKFDVMGNTAGGIKKGARALDNLDVIVTFDGEKILNAQGLSATVHLLNNFGGRPDADLVGSGQGVDNIETPRPTGKLFQAFLEQNLFDDKLSVLAGLYAVDSEFYITDTSGLFMHSTFGIGTDIAQSGQNGPSIFPFTSVGSRVRVKPTEETYLQAAILDGVPGDVDDVRGTHIHFKENDGLLMIGEAGYTPADSKIAIGAWGYTEKFDHFTQTGEKERSQGAYLLGETALYKENDGEGLAGFARFGTASGAVNQFEYAWSAGLVYTGLIPTRDEGQLGFGVTGARNGSEYRQAALAANAPADDMETTFELTYSDKITPWLSVQPDFQYVMNPGTDRKRGNAVVLGTRFTIDF